LQNRGRQRKHRALHPEVLNISIRTILECFKQYLMTGWQNSKETITFTYVSQRLMHASHLINETLLWPAGQIVNEFDEPKNR
jgi:hypothetical protein